MTPNYHELELPSLYGKPNYEAMPKGTDVYFFGLPVSGKTSLLMGLTGAEGKGCNIKFKAKGGSYAQALKKYVEAGVMPYSCPSNFISIVSAMIEEKRMGRNEKEVYWNHEINFVEMSGEEFANKIANNDKTVSLADMGEGTLNLLRNNNRKVFFIIVDPTRDIFSFTFGKPKYDTNGTLINIDMKSELVNTVEACFRHVSNGRSCCQCDMQERKQ